MVVSPLNIASTGATRSIVLVLIAHIVKSAGTGVSLDKCRNGTAKAVKTKFGITLQRICCSRGWSNCKSALCPVISSYYTSTTDNGFSALNDKSEGICPKTGSSGGVMRTSVSIGCRDCRLNRHWPMSSAPQLSCPRPPSPGPIRS